MGIYTKSTTTSCAETKEKFSYMYLASGIEHTCENMPNISILNIGGSNSDLFGCDTVTYNHKLTLVMPISSRPSAPQLMKQSLEQSKIITVGVITFRSIVGIMSL